MKKKSIFIIALFAFSCIPVQAQKKKAVKKELSFKERQWEKKKLKAAERIDQAITAALLAALGNQAVQKWNIYPFPDTPNSFVDIKKHSPKITGLALLAKLGITLRRMHLLDQYVGWNPFKMVPSMLYFVGVDMASWRWK